jgi:hypothetical protein
VALCERLLTIRWTTEPQLVAATDCSTLSDHPETENTKHLEHLVRASAPCECFQDEKFLFVPTTKHYPCVTNAFHAGIIAWSVDNTRDSVKGTCITEVQCKYDQVSFYFHTTQTTRGNHPYSKYCQCLNDCRTHSQQSAEPKTCSENY